MVTISIINLKGGVAKTTSSVNMAHILNAVHKKKVLLVDNDKQGNASKFFNRHSYEKAGVAEVMTDIEESVADLEDEVFDYEDEDDVDDFDELDEMYETTCPNCENTIRFDYEQAALGGMDCPNCGQHLEFELEDDDE